MGSEGFKEAYIFLEKFLELISNMLANKFARSKMMLKSGNRPLTLCPLNLFSEKMGSLQTCYISLFKQNGQVKVYILTDKGLPEPLCLRYCTQIADLVAMDRDEVLLPIMFYSLCNDLEKLCCYLQLTCYVKVVSKDVILVFFIMALKQQGNIAMMQGASGVSGFGISEVHTT